MEGFERKSLLYKTRVEYGDYTINHIMGCSHGCRYPCYAMMLSRRFGRCSSYEEWCQPKIVTNAMYLLEKELPSKIDKINKIHLCFMSDPFMYGHPEISALSVKIMKYINNYGLICSTLTKGVVPEDVLTTSKKNEIGITVVSLDNKFCEQYEPGAAPVSDRIKSLCKVHECGFKTWISIEPYPTPNIIEQDLSELLESVSFADHFIFGKMNYNSLVSKYPNNKEFYNNCVKIVVDFCKKNNKTYHIKNGTISI